jgi:hypothetical protein
MLEAPLLLSRRPPCFMLLCMKTRWALLLLMLCCALTLPVKAAVYRWLDHDGVVHYSDQPTPGAKAIDLPETSHYAPPALGNAVPQPAEEKSGAPATGGPYKRFSIVHPADGETLHNATGDLDVTMGLEPGLRKGHQIQLVLDGLGARQTVDSLHAVLKHVERGAHTLQAEVLDAGGRTLIRAMPVRFYLLMPSAAEPSVGKPPENNQQSLSPSYPQIPGNGEAFPSEPGGGKTPAYAPSYTQQPSGDQAYPSSPTDTGKTYPGIPSRSGGAFPPADSSGRGAYQPHYGQSR